MSKELSSIRFHLVIITALLTFGTIYFAKDVVLPIILGILLSLTLSPLIRLAGRVGIAPPVAAFFVTFSLAAAGGIGTYTLGGIVSSWVDEAPELSQQLRDKMSSILQSVEALQDASDEVENIAAPESENLQKVVVKQPGLLSSTLGSLASFGTSLLVGLVLALLLLASGDLFYAKLVETFPRLRDKKRALTIVHHIERAISRYLLSITLINAGLGLSIALSFYLLGVPQFYVWGAIAFLMNFVPYLGALIGVGLVSAFAIITFDELSFAMIVPSIYLILTTIEGQFVTPWLLGRRMELNTVSVFLTVIVWSWLWGVAGALIAVPILVAFKLICDNIDGWSSFSNFLGSKNSTCKSSAGDGFKKIKLEYSKN